MDSKITRRGFLGAAAKAGLAVGAARLAGNLSSIDGVYAATKELEVEWYGHSFFSLRTSGGTKVVIDPYGSMGYPMPGSLQGDILTVSHEHFDHNNVGLVKGSPTVIRGLKDGGRDWDQIDQSIKDIRLYTIPTYHDGERGAKRGRNSIFVYEVDDLRLAHLGDLGHLLSDEELRMVGKVDLLFIPVGGFYTIDGHEATKVLEQIKPWAAIPMHYKTKVLPGWPGSDEGPFVRGKSGVRRTGKTTLKISKDSLPKSREIWVMSYEEEAPASQRAKPDDKTEAGTSSN
jgi:L-ascorbate metabolism protein UlaG (beta-lactamase superfamily)